MNNFVLIGNVVYFNRHKTILSLEVNGDVFKVDLSNFKGDEEKYILIERLSVEKAKISLYGEIKLDDEDNIYLKGNKFVAINTIIKE